MSELSEYAAGARCDLHDIPFCADCAARLGLRRGVETRGVGADDERATDWRFNGDCSIATIRELTGASYDEAVELLGSGFSSRTGARAEVVIKALESVGYRTERRGLGIVSRRGTRYSGMSIPDARAASVDSGRLFFLFGADRRGGHAWSIVDGTVNRAYLAAPYKYGIVEVIA